MSKNEFKNLCWNITAKCNESCLFCYRKKCMDNTLEENKKIFDNLSQINLEKISFCGGEPLLYDDLFDLVKYIKSKNSKIKLSITTNGKVLDSKKQEELLKYFDIISLPLDSTNNNINEIIGRGKEHYNNIINILDNLNNKIKIKINTVVNKQNIDCIKEIYDTISKYNITRWKLFRFLPARDAKNYKDMFYITKDETKELQKWLTKINEESSISIEYNDFEGKASCFSVQPDGSLEDGNNVVIGNLLTDSVFEIIAKKEEEIKKMNNRKRK